MLILFYFVPLITASEVSTRYLQQTFKYVASIWPKRNTTRNCCLVIVYSVYKQSMEWLYFVFSYLQTRKSGLNKSAASYQRRVAICVWSIIAYVVVQGCIRWLNANVCCRLRTAYSVPSAPTFWKDGCKHKHVITIAIQQCYIWIS